MKKITRLLTLLAVSLFSVAMSAQAVLPVELSTDSEKHYYAIKSLKKNKYVFGSAGQAGRLSSDKDALNAIWYFLAGSDGKVIIKNCSNESLDVSQNAVLGNNKVEWTIGQQDGNESYYISHDGSSGWNDANGFGFQIGTYGNQDGGSAFAFEAVETLPQQALAEEIVASTPDNKVYYSIRSARSGKYLAYNGEHGVIQQDQNFSANGYFYVEAVDGGFSIKNVCSTSSLGHNGSWETTFGDNVDIFNFENVSTTVGAVYVKVDGYYLNDRGGCGNHDNGDIIVYGGIDSGDEFIFTEVELPKLEVEEQWNQASSAVEANGIKYSAIHGEKFYYTLESRRMFANARYASVSGLKFDRSINPDSDVNKWYFLRGKNGENSVVIVNAATNFMLAALNGTMSFNSYKEFYIFDSKKNPGFKCISADANSIDSGQCLDASNNNTSLSSGWRDELNGGTAWTINEIDVEDVLMRQIEGSSIEGTSKSYIATYSSPFNMFIPNGVEVYTVNDNHGDYVSLSRYSESVLPANTGVILLGDENSYQFSPEFTAVAALENNMLKASSYNEPVVMGENSYVLGTNANETQFYKATGSLSKNKAYLILDKAAMSIKMNFGDEVSGIEAVTDTVKNSVIYDLSGRCVNAVVKGGVYIKNGKKFFVK